MIPPTHAELMRYRIAHLQRVASGSRYHRDRRRGESPRRPDPAPEPTGQ
jgi:hypothetical protein